MRQVHIKRATPSFSDIAAIRKVYEDAAKLTGETGVPHDVDHIIPLRGELYVDCMFTGISSPFLLPKTAERTIEDELAAHVARCTSVTKMPPGTFSWRDVAILQ